MKKYTHSDFLILGDTIARTSNYNVELDKCILNRITEDKAVY